MRDPSLATPLPLPQYRVGPLGAHVDGFAEWLIEQDYRRDTVRTKLRLVADFSLWLGRRRLSLASLDKQTVGRFLHGRRRRNPCGARLTLRLLLDRLRHAGVVGDPAGEEGTGSPLQLLERSFEHYLTQERGLSPATLANTLPFVRQFLVERFGPSEISLTDLDPRDIAGFVRRRAHTLSPARAKLLVGALRSFFRFLRLRGDIATDLAAVVPSVADWRRTALPKSLPPEQVDKLLTHCDQDTVSGLRDYAVLLLLARLGLRAGEVVALTLEDLDWHAGEIEIRGKGSRRDRLPMPHEVGQALASYLRRARPRCSTRRVFVRLRAPIRELADQRAVGTIVRQALARAGLHPPCKGAHLLRHSLAVRMLQRGASLAEIGEILRHRLPDTTMIYAKVDLDALRALAQPWPGGDA